MRESEQLIRELLTEAGATDLPAPGGALPGQGIESAARHRGRSIAGDLRGLRRARTISSRRRSWRRTMPANYSAPAALAAEPLGARGSLERGGENSPAAMPPALRSCSVSMRAICTWCSRPGRTGARCASACASTGTSPGADHGADVDEHGNGKVQAQRLYQLIRQSGTIGDHTFSIEFLDAGVQAYSFTFG